MGEWRLAPRLYAGAFLFVLALASLVSPGAGAHAQSGSHRAGLVVRYSDGSMATRCVSFAESSITGLDLLQRSGLPIVIGPSSSIGLTVCKIGREGCDTGKSCFCQCEGSTCAYWQYFYIQAGAWKYSALGAAVRQVPDGGVEGWSWGNGEAPPLMSFEQVCPASASPAAQSLATPAPTRLSASPVPSATLPASVAPAPASPVPATPALAAATPVAALDTALAASPTPEPTAVSAPAASPTLEPTAVLAPAASSPASPSSGALISYSAFGLIVIALVVWLAVQRRRKAG